MLVSSEKCTGCGACVKSCPQKAIQYKDDAEGFPTPYIDTKLCVQCGICDKVCPALHIQMHPIQAAYAAQILDEEALKESTSGGLFTVLSREIFRRNGVVYGCVWDEDYNAVIRKAENEEELKPMRGSKYVWSWAGDSFPEIEKELKEGRIVMFTGLPCQVGGLKNYLKRDYDNLYLVDFFCGGAPSPYAFHEYLKTITDKVSLEKLNFKFRDKEKYGVGVHISYEGPKGRIQQSYVSNPYFFCYHTKVFHRKSCYQCQYRYSERVEDLTIGDYWGVGHFHDEFNIRAGVSALLVNSVKGNDLFDAVRDKLLLSPTRTDDIAKGNNLTLSDELVTFDVPFFRDDFFALMRAKGWKAAEHRYLYNKTRLKLWLKLKMSPNMVRKIKRLKHILGRN